jgi:hypothetical protein
MDYDRKFVNFSKSIVSNFKRKYLALVAYFALMNPKYFHTTHFVAPGRS